MTQPSLRPRKKPWKSHAATGRWQCHGVATIFAVVDALTRISGKLANAGERSAVDQKASALLSLAK